MNITTTRKARKAEQAAAVDGASAGSDDAAQGSPGKGVKQRKAPTPPATKARRKPALTAAGVALIALGGVGGGWLASQGGTAKQVVMLRNSIQPGHKISMSDLTTTQMTGGVGANLVPADQIQQLVGRYPTGKVPAGSLVSWPMTTTNTSPTSGTALVGLAFKAGQIPAAGLQPGQKVVVVLSNVTANTSSSQQLPAGLTIGKAWNATIAALPASSPNAQATTVDLYIAGKDVGQVATASGLGSLTLAVTGAGGTQ